MGQFAGFVILGGTLKGALQVRNSSGTPINADALPLFRVYGPGSPPFMTSGSGTCSFLDSGSITGATNASPIVITSANHGLTTGTRVTITGVVGNTAANATWIITNVSTNTFSLNGSTGNGAYTSGGTWNVTGAYRYSINALGADGYEAGKNYAVLFTFAVSSTQRGDVDTFQVS